MRIEINNLSKHYGPIKAVNGLNAVIEEGITALIGENGSGKSTLLRLLAGVIDPSEGQILINGSPVEEKKTPVFFLPDEPYYDVSHSLGSLKRIYASFYSFDEERLAYCLKQFGLNPKQRLSSYSKGMRRQAMLSLAIASSAPILLLDEAFDGLDALSLSFIKDQLLAISEGKIIVAASHNAEAARSMASRFLLLYKGRLGQDADSADFGANLVKYQALLPNSLTPADLEELGLQVVLFRHLGSITHFIVKENEEGIARLKEAYKPALLESVPMEENETLAAELSLAKKEGRIDE